MMKKILLILFSIILLSNFVSATEYINITYNDVLTNFWNGGTPSLSSDGGSYSADYPSYNVSGNGSTKSRLYDNSDTSTMSSFDPDITWSINMWVKLNEQVDNTYVFDKVQLGGTNNNRMFFLTQFDTGEDWIRTYAKDGTNSATCNFFNTTGKYYNQWGMLTWVKGNGWNACYVNGVLVDNNTDSQSGNIAATDLYFNRYSISVSAHSDYYIDNFKVWNSEQLIETEIINLYNYNYKDYVPPTTDPVYIAPSPANSSSNNTQVIFNINCTNDNVYAWLDSNKTITNQTSPANFTTNVNASGEYTINAACYNVANDIFSNNLSRTWFYDAVFPNIETDFINNTVLFETLEAQFNFTDDFFLNSYNISIDGNTIAYNDSLTGTSHQVNLSYSISNLTAGYHDLKVKLADGHTANKIPDYEVSTGLFNNYLKYSWHNKEGIKKNVKISNEDNSLFDTFSTKKEIDSYTWDFQPSNLKNTYTFNIETDDPIRIIESNETYLKTWITFGNKWLDFDLFGENATVKITKINDNFVKVKVSNINKPEKQKYQSIGDLNVKIANYVFYKINASVTYQTTVFEGSITSLLLKLEIPDIQDYNINTTLIWNSSSKNITQINVSDDITDYNSAFIVPDLNVTNITWTFYFDVNSSNFNISGMSAYVQMDITNCTAGNYIVLNYTIYDEETLTKPTGINATIENYLTLTTPSFLSNFYNFTIKQNDTELLICLPNNTLANSSFILDARTKYYYDDHVEEFHYIENFNLTKDVIPKEIKLYDLLAVDSTSFLVTYQNENYLYLEGVIVDLLRQYTFLNGEFFSVEHGKTDQSGQTVLHLVTEDVIYKANVWQDGNLIYTTGEFQSVCQTDPCTINLREDYNSTEGISDYENIVYSITNQNEFYTTKTIVFDFSTVDGTSTTILMNVSQSTNLLNQTICASSKTLSAGSIVCTIPIAYYNSTYTARVFKDGEFLGWRTYTLEPNADDIFGRTGVFLGGIGYLLLSLMGISSGIVAIILGVVGFIAMGYMNLLLKSSIYGIGSSIIWLIVATGILVWKYLKRRVQ